MNASRFIGCLLKRGFNHVRKENKCKNKKLIDTICPEIVSVCPLSKALKEEIVCLDPRAESEVYIPACYVFNLT